MACGFLQVIEARNMRLPSDMLHAFFSMDAYAVVTVSNDEAGMPAAFRQTRVFRNSLTPSWNESLSFSGIQSASSLTLALYDHKKLTSDIYLGQVCLLPPVIADAEPSHCSMYQSFDTWAFYLCSHVFTWAHAGWGHANCSA